MRIIIRKITINFAIILITGTAVASSDSHSDYYDYQEGMESTISPPIPDPTEHILELAVVCDIEFGKLFGNSTKEIADYLAVYFWDVTTRFRTLQRTHISFFITSITLINSTYQQPFIVRSRTLSSNGKSVFTNLHDRFEEWALSRKHVLPKFDTPMLFTKAAVDWTGGLSYLSAACHMELGTRRIGALAMWDDGTWYSTKTAAYKFGKLLQNSRLGSQQCEDHFTYQADIHVAMGDKKHHFSQCFGRLIAEYVHSSSGSCLARKSSKKPYPVLDPDYDNNLPSTLDEQCQKKLGDRNATANFTEENACSVVECVLPVSSSNGSLGQIYPVENTPCGNGKRCFRGRCIPPGSLIVNVGSGQCLQSSNKFTYNDNLIITNCPRSSTPTDRFSFIDHPTMPHAFEKLISAPYTTDVANETPDKCLVSLNNGTITFDRCNNSSSNGSNPLTWRVFPDIEKAIIISSVTPTKCLKQVGDQVKLLDSCNGTDPSSSWRLVPVVPLPGTCPEDGKCDVQMEVTIDFRGGNMRNNTYTVVSPLQPLLMRVNLTSTKGAAVAPAVVISIPTNLARVPPNCFPMASVENHLLETWKCKLGRLLQQGNTSVIADLELDMVQFVSDKSSLPNAYEMKFSVAATTASRLLQPAEASANITCKLPVACNFAGENATQLVTLQQAEMERGTNDTITFEHVYKLDLSQSVTSILNFSVSFRVPHGLSSSNGQNIVNVTVKNVQVRKTVSKDKFSMICGRGNLTIQRGHLAATKIGTNGRKPVLVASIDSSSVLSYMEFICEVTPNTTKSLSAVISLTLEVQKTALGHLLQTYGITDMQAETTGTLNFPAEVELQRAQNPTSEERVITVIEMNIDKSTTPRRSETTSTLKYEKTEAAVGGRTTKATTTTQVFVDAAISAADIGNHEGVSAGGANSEIQITAEINAGSSGGKQKNGVSSVIITLLVVLVAIGLITSVALFRKFPELISICRRSGDSNQIVSPAHSQVSFLENDCVPLEALETAPPSELSSRSREGVKRKEFWRK